MFCLVYFLEIYCVKHYVFLVFFNIQEHQIPKLIEKDQLLNKNPEIFAFLPSKH